MISPRHTTLVSVTGLRAMHRAIAGSCAPADPARSRGTAVLVPTRSAAGQLRLTLEDLWLIEAGQAGDRAVVFPDILTRADWYRRLHQRLGVPPLGAVEREVVLAAAAREAVAAGDAPPFRMRPGLVAEMLAFYDALHRRGKAVADFERLVLDDLAPRAEFDRGAERLLRQTRFLAAAFRLFAHRLDGCSGLDEHRLRQRLLDGGTDAPWRHVIVAMGDEVAEPAGGLFPADFDLLARLAGIESIEIVATRSALLSGLGERLRALLPGIEDDVRGDVDESPSLVAPPGNDRVHFTSRDREEELRGIARRLKAEPTLGDGTRPRTAIVFRRPLPYVYLGRTVLESARIDHRAADALPLAAEPFAAAVDVVLSAVKSRFARAPLLQLLRSPHFRFVEGSREPTPADLDALDRALADAGYLGDRARLDAFAERAPSAAAVAARVAATVAAGLAPLGEKATVSAHVATLVTFVQAHERLPRGDEAVVARHLRARAAILRLLADLRSASLAHDDPVVDLSDLSARIRRWFESETFMPSRGTAGVHLVDAQAARFGDFDVVHLAGLVAGDWPESSPRNIFYPQFLLSALGWPPESSRLAAERAAFADLLRLPRRQVSVSAFILENDSIVEPSPLLEEIERAGLDVHRPPDAPRLVFADEALTADEGSPEDVSDPAVSRWLALRRSRTPADDPRFHGEAGADPRGAPAAARYTVTGIDRYLECPFKYFARHVLDLPEAVQDEQVMSPRERGRFVHEVFRAFFAEWQRQGGGAITPHSLDASRALFARIVERQLTGLPPAEAALERLRLLGSVAAPGLGEIVLAAEAVRPTPVVERLLEFAFDGTYSIASAGVERAIPLRGKADRVDLLADGRMRIIDYKIGRAPIDSIQLPVYAVCLEQHLCHARGRTWEIGEALYIAFGERGDAVDRVIGEGAKASAALDEAQGRVLAAVDGIERGEFPPRPAAPRLCGTCAYADVCRKDYVGAD